MRLSSSAFERSGDIPAKYTCNGENISPPLSIKDVPKQAKSLVLIMDDPDAANEPKGSGNTFDHWVVYNIAPEDQEVNENSVPKNGEQGLNGRGDTTYTGPCPPSFKHAYIFRVFALDTKLMLTAPTKAEVEEAMSGHVIEQCELVGYYEQPQR